MDWVTRARRNLEVEVLYLSRALLGDVSPQFVRGLAPSDRGASHEELEAPAREDVPDAVACKDAFLRRLVALVLGIVDDDDCPTELSVEDMLADAQRSSQFFTRMHEATEAPEARAYWAEATAVALALTEGLRRRARPDRGRLCYASGPTAEEVESGDDVLTADVLMVESEHLLWGLDEAFESLKAGNASGLRLAATAGPALPPPVRKRRIERVADLATDVAMLACDLESPEASVERLLVAEGLHREMGTLQTSRGVSVLLALAAARGHTGDFEGASRELQRVEELLDRTGTLHTVEGASLLGQLASLQARLGDAEAALCYFERAREIRERTDSLDTPHGVALLQSLSFVQGQLSHNEGQLESLRLARDILERLECSDSLHGADLLTSLALAEWRRGDLRQAEAHLGAARGTREKANELRTEEGAELLTHLGAVKAQLKDAEGAFAAFQAAQDVHSQLGTLESEKGAGLLTKIAFLKEQGGDLASAYSYLKIAADIRKHCGLLDASEGDFLKAKMRELLRAIEEADVGAASKSPPGLVAVPGA